MVISKVHFSTIVTRTLTKGEYTIIDIIMYQDAVRSVVVKEGAKAKISLTSPDIMIADNV